MNKRQRRKIAKKRANDIIAKVIIHTINKFIDDALLSRRGVSLVPYKPYTPYSVGTLIDKPISYKEDK